MKYTDLLDKDQKVLQNVWITSVILLDLSLHRYLFNSASSCSCNTMEYYPWIVLQYCNTMDSIPIPILEYYPWFVILTLIFSFLHNFF